MTPRDNIDRAKQSGVLYIVQPGGSVRDAESLLGQALVFAQTSEKENVTAQDIRELLGVVETQSIGDFVDLIVAKKTAEAVSMLNEVADKGFDLQEYCKSLISYLRNGLILGISGAKGPNDGELVTGLTDQEFEKLKTQTQSLGTPKLQKIIELFLSAQDRIKYSPIPQLPMELAIVSACS